MSRFSRFLLAGAGALLLALAMPGAPDRASAQAAVCQQIRAELASLGRGRGPTRESTRYRRELGRVQNAMAVNECHRSGGLFGIGGPPPVCGPLKAQAAQLQAQINAMEGGGDDGRRLQLMRSYAAYGCDGPQRAEPREQRGVLYATPNDRPNVFERLFGGRTEVPVEAFPPRGLEPLDDGPLREGEEDEPRRRRGGSVAVCVRTCDGFFFPVNFEGLRARDDYGDVCKTLCPAAETRVFFMSYGGQIEDAASVDGTPYASQPYARKYQENRDAACICKHPAQTWASAMQGKPDLVEMRKGDILVSKEQAEQMSRPKALNAGKNARQQEALRKLEDPATRQENARQENTRQEGVRNVAPGLTGSGLRTGSGEARRP